MYELGMSHALKKEVIIIYDRDKLSKKLPFDITYIRARMYINDYAGGIQLRKDLEETMEYVLSKIQDFQLTKIFKQTKDQQDREQLFMVRTHFEQRRNRIEYFTYHIIDLMFHSISQYTELKKQIEAYRLNPSEDEWLKIKRSAKFEAEFMRNYTMDFTKFQLENAKNFLHSAWLSIKFEDELATLNSEMAGIGEIDSPRGGYSSYGGINGIQGRVDYRISRINFWIQVMQEERDRVGLKTVQNKYKKDEINT